MIATTDKIRQVRPVAQNIDDVARLQPYMNEAELLYILPVIGAGLYKWLDETDFSGDGPFVYMRGDGTAITITKEQHKEILYGGYYSTDCCSDGHSIGLIAASSYYAYSRAVLEHQVNVTSFGVVMKRSEFSNPVDAGTLSHVSNKANKLAQETMRQVVEHLKALNLLECGTKKHRKPKFMTIGRYKM